MSYAYEFVTHVLIENDFLSVVFSTIDAKPRQFIEIDECNIKGF